MADTTITSLPTASGIDGAVDWLAIDRTSLGATQKINRQTYLGVSGQPMDISSSQNVTNKTLDNTNTITLKDTLFTLQDDGDTTKQARFQLSGITTATTRTYTLPNASSTIADIATSQTFTNKTLTAPVINNGSITGTTITNDAIVGQSASTSGTVYGLSISSSKISGTSITNSTITGTQIANSTVTASKLATGAATATVATSETTTSVSFVSLATTTDAVTVTIGVNGLALVSIISAIAGLATNYSLVSFALSGANTLAASDSNATYVLGSTDTRLGFTMLLTGLTPGSTTFSMKYRVSAGTGTFGRRNISVVPL